MKVERKSKHQAQISKKHYACSFKSPIFMKLLPFLRLELLITFCNKQDVKILIKFVKYLLDFFPLNFALLLICMI